MQKRMVSVLTSAALWLAVLASAVGLALPASAATVGDVEEAVAVLTGLGIVSGYSDGLYHPEDGLTRAQFCKLAILAEGHGDQAAGSSYRSLFTDVSAADWALSYINLAYEEGLMAGKGDGTFGPGEAVTLEQAVTVCLRLLGYTDKDIGPFWPEDYLSKAGKLGLLNGVSANGSDALDRGQAALLLYNLIQMENAQGKVFGLGLGASSVSDAVLLDNDAEAADGTLHTAKVYANGNLQWYEQAAAPAGSLVGRRGTLLLDKSGRVCGFLPDDSICKTITVEKATASAVEDTLGNSYSLSGDIPVLEEDEKTSYQAIWYDLEGRELTLYYAESGGVILAAASDPIAYDGVMLSGYYENASPNASDPNTITLLGHTFEVADDVLGLSALAVGDKITVSLNGAGEVVRAWSYSEQKAAVIAVLDSAGQGKFTHISGLALNAEISNTSKAQELEGTLVKVNPSGQGKCSVTALSSGSTSADLNVASKKLGTVALSANVKLYDQVSGAVPAEIKLEDILTDTVAAKSILYVGTNGKGEVDLLVLDNVTGDGYTYGIYRTKTVTETVQGLGECEAPTTNSYTTVAIENSGGTTAYFRTLQFVRSGTAGGIACAGTEKIAGFAALTKVQQVPRSAFDGEDAAVLEDIRVPIADDVQVYNSETDSWIDLAAAKGYTDSYTVYYSGKLGTTAKVRLVVIEQGA